LEDREDPSEDRRGIGRRPGRGSALSGDDAHGAIRSPGIFTVEDLEADDAELRAQGK
jgi:hypothetical protein